jgi:pimeloyl-ACP methyl ester carboxylesterase
MATIVLVHGAWLGGWVWSRVVPDLWARGHTVYAPTLTGLGDRAHLLDTDVDLELHATDIVSLLECEDLQRVLLVAHGYGGAVAQHVAARAPERLGRLLFLDALLAEDGQTLLDALGPHAAALQTRADDTDGVPVYGPDLGLLLDGLTKRDADWVEDRLTPMPAAPYTAPLTAAGFFALSKPTLFATCADGDPAASAAFASAHGFTAYEIAAPHLPMIAKPEPTAELIDNFARQPARALKSGADAAGADDMPPAPAAYES